METEKVLQRMLKGSKRLPRGVGLPEAVSTKVMSLTKDKELFPELHSHQFDMAVEDNHVHLLVKRIAAYFARIRLYHIGKEQTYALKGPSVRQKLTKLILFKNN